jgi:hypothetical protein
MQDIKYHIITVLGAFVLAYTFAITANRVVRFVLTPVEYTPLSSQQSAPGALSGRSNVDLDSIYAGGFFRTADGELDSAAPAMPEQPTDLVLLGTITGPATIARAIIRKKSEPESKIYRLWEDVYGYKLVSITNFKVYLRSGTNTVVLDMYAKENTGQPAPGSKRTAPGADHDRLST